MANNPTDILVLKGIPGKIIKIAEVEFSATKSGAPIEQADFLILKRTGFSDGGTYTNPLISKYDEQNQTINNDIVRLYTANPSVLSNVLATLKTIKVNIANLGLNVQVLECLFNMEEEQRPTLREGETICINLNSSTITFEKANVYIVFTLEDA